MTNSYFFFVFIVTSDDDTSNADQLLEEVDKILAADTTSSYNEKIDSAKIFNEEITETSEASSKSNEAKNNINHHTTQEIESHESSDLENSHHPRVY